MRPGAAPLLLLLAGVLGGCGQWQRAGTEPQRPAAGSMVPQLFDTRSIYTGMGYVVGTPPLTFVASIRFLATGTPDSTLAVFAMSLPNHGLSFRHTGSQYVAQYHIEISFRRDTVILARVSRDETVRVQGFRETLRSDESVIFQQFIPVPPGVCSVRVAVRDRDGPAYAEQERLDTVPQFATAGLAAPLAFYDGAGRSARTLMPVLVTNPRAMLPYGEDTLRFYVEGYGMPQGARLAAHVIDGDSVVLWRDTVPLVGDSDLVTAGVVIGPGVLPIGRAKLVVEAIGTTLTAQAPLLVSLSDQWATSNFLEMLSLLRYFDRQDLLQKLKNAAPEDRAKLWREFYKESDPVPVTPGNEALDEYFGRLAMANQRFQEPGTAGWLTERGEVFITLGEPTEVYDASHDVTATQTRLIRWEYTQLRLTLFFEDLNGFGQFRLTPASRSDYQRILAQVRARL